MLGHSPGRHNTSSNDIILDKVALNMEPVLKPQPTLLSLDDKILLNVARANVLSQISVSTQWSASFALHFTCSQIIIFIISNFQVLNLHGNSLSKIKEISRLTALRHLTISFNEFTCLDDISHMVKVTKEYKEYILIELKLNSLSK